MSRQMIIGLTGGIGSGKSTAAACFRKLGIPVLDADYYARKALDKGTVCYERTVALFGREFLKEDGTIDRKKVADMVFKNEDLRSGLNAIIHPYVLEQMKEHTKECSETCVIWEVPLLFESGYDRCCDRTVTILCRENIRIRRICERDGITEEQAMDRIKAQMTDERRASLADNVLYNEGTEQELMHRVAQLVKQWKMDR